MVPLQNTNTQSLAATAHHCMFSFAFAFKLCSDIALAVCAVQIDRSASVWQKVDTDNLGHVFFFFVIFFHFCCEHTMAEDRAEFKVSVEQWKSICTTLDINPVVPLFVHIAPSTFIMGTLFAKNKMFLRSIAFDPRSVGRVLYYARLVGSSVEIATGRGFSEGKLYSYSEIVHADVILFDDVNMLHSWLLHMKIGSVLIMRNTTTFHRSGESYVIKVTQHDGYNMFITMIYCKRFVFEIEGRQYVIWKIINKFKK